MFLKQNRLQLMIIIIVNLCFSGAKGQLWQPQLQTTLKPEI